jgi:predicted DNA-binding transcriptional regulator YafY
MESNFARGAESEVARMVYSPATRLLGALDLLQSRPRVSAAQLADRLEVQARSVRRYMTMLQDMGIPVEAVRGRYGGYRLRPGFKLPPLMLTEDEALAVTLGLLAARRLRLGSDAASVEGALAKVERVLPLGLRERLRAVQETVALDLDLDHAFGAPGESAAVARHLLALSAAAHQGRRVWLRYRAPREEGGAEETERPLDPYGLVYHEARWYVVGHCHLRGEVRVFRLDRVLAVAPLAATFTHPAGFDCLAFAVRRFAAMPDRWLVEVALETTLERLSGLVPPSFATLEEVPGGVLLRAYDRDLEHTARFLVGLGCPFTVRQPPELRAALEALAARIARAVAPSA